MVFSTLIGNADMPLKNWSLIYPDRRRAALSPGYEFVPTIPYIKDDKMALKYARSKRVTDLTDDELSYLTAKARLPEKLVLAVAHETAERLHAAWKSESAHPPLTAAIRQTIERHVESIPLARKRLLL